MEGMRNEWFEFVPHAFGAEIIRLDGYERERQFASSA